jgi:hypothetical protein
MLELATILDQGLPRRVQVLYRRFRISVRLRSGSVRIYRAVLLVLSLRTSSRKVRTIFQTMNAAPALTVTTQHYVRGEPKLRAAYTFGFEISIGKVEERQPVRTRRVPAAMLAERDVTFDQRRFDRRELGFAEILSAREPVYRSGIHASK